MKEFETVLAMGQAYKSSGVKRELSRLLLEQNAKQLGFFLPCQAEQGFSKIPTAAIDGRKRKMREMTRMKDFN